MPGLADGLKTRYDGTADPRAVVQGDRYRFTVLADELLRLEYSEDGVFEDRPTQAVTNRRFPVPGYTVTESGDTLEIETKAFRLSYIKGERFSARTLYINVLGAYSSYNSIWRYGDSSDSTPLECNLRGTARTLDFSDGEIGLGLGLCDRRGRAFFDDSASLALDEEGWPCPRRKGNEDCYYFAYGHDYYKAVHDFYLLSGPVPLLPRYALGNWWSRYWKYTEDSYLELLERFDREGIPFSVGVFDMDWHIVDVPERYGKGWTGYTWNRELFPDPERLLRRVHEKGLHITLNLHPAAGCMPYEEAYEAMCEALGQDPGEDKPVACDVTSKEFLSAYFKYLHHPHEEIGVDFWWIDWQQGTESGKEGFDPLRILNHFHYIDSSRSRERRGLILSRFGGLGDQRYPLGFSGDTAITWEALRFQPYFTSTASNIGYTWWSHDIGGHMLGKRDNELFTRWVQFGVFSPVNRLHSSSDPFLAKEPWSYPEPYHSVINSFLRLRHALIPYIYTMNWRVHELLVPFILPMYYGWPELQGAYECPGEYMFGSELIAVPVTEPVDRESLQGTAKAFLPPGLWVDFFTGTVYDGGEKGRDLKVSRPIDACPVFAKAGGIVPQDRFPGNSARNPECLDILLFAGADGSFTLYEDSGDGYGYEEGEWVKTEITLSFSGERALCSLHSHGKLPLIPEGRKCRLILRGVSEGARAEGYECSYDKATHSLTADIGALPESLSVVFSGVRLYHDEDLAELCFNALLQMQIDNVVKNRAYRVISSGNGKAEILGSLLSMEGLPGSVLTALTEILSRQG